MRREEVVIIGAGPAGLSTALQLKRHGITALLFERDCIGGLLRNANLVENYPGFPGGVPGTVLVRLFEEQAQAACVEVTLDEVIDLTYTEGTFRITTPARAYDARIVVVASGTRPGTFPDDWAPAHLRDRILYEVYPLLHETDKRIVIVGAGDAAFDYALNLSRRNDVLILNRGDQTHCLPLLRERVAASPRIRYCDNMAVVRVESSSENGLSLECTGPAGPVRFEADYVVGAIGREPQLAFMSDRLLAAARDLESQGMLYFVGDVKNGRFRQTAIAVGEGILTAMKIHARLQEITP